MRRMIYVLNEDMAEKLMDEGHRCTEQGLDSGQTAYVFLENEDLHKELKNKRKYSKRDWFYSNKMFFNGQT